MKILNHIINEKNIVFRLGENAKENHQLIDDQIQMIGGFI